MLSEQKNKDQLKPNKRRIKLLFISFILLRSILWITFILILVSCNTTEPPPIKPPEKPKVIFLQLVTKSSTEAFIKVTAKDTLLPAPITIKRDGTEIMNFYLTINDTTIIDTGLAAGKTYTYKPMAIVNGKPEEGDSLFVTTLDTTSNDFTWQTFTFGEHSSSTLSDVAIIADNDIWAVGEIYMNDSNGQPDINAYNAVHWDGNQWKLRRISVMYHDNLITTSLEGIFAFSNNDIWVTNGFPIHGDGNTWKMYHLQDMGISVSVSKIWGKNSNNMYFIGIEGNIAHYNGTSWTTIESGTTTDLKDIWGIKNATDTSPLILTSASNRFSN